jgi:Tol biopolymer transport system component
MKRSAACSSILSVGFLLLFLIATAGCNKSASGQSGKAGRINNIAFSPDGRFIVLSYSKTGSCFIYKVALDSGNAIQLTRAKAGYESSPTISADGELIAYSYAEGRGAHSHILVTDVDGLKTRFLTQSESDDSFPMFTANGRQIYFARSRFFGNYSPTAQPHQHEWGIFSADIEGTNVRQLTRESLYDMSKPSLSPDGKSLLFATHSYETGAQFVIYSLEQPAKPKRVLQPHVPGEPKLSGRPSPEFNNPNYLPDGSIVFMAASQGKSGFDYDVYRMESATGSLEKLTSDNGYSTGLCISPDGKTAMFLKWKLDWHKTPAESKLYSLDLQTHKVTLVKISGLD